MLPSLMLVLLQLSYKLRKLCDTALKRLLYSLLIVFLGVSMYVGVRFFLALCKHFLEDEAQGAKQGLMSLNPKP